MFDTNKEIIWNSLKMWANYIETGDVCVSVCDAELMDRKVKPLTLEQKKFVVRILELADDILSERIIVDKN